jgi:Flp pilus assembly protein TadG
MDWVNQKENQKGASAVEFAILLPVLVLLLFGTVEFGLLLYNQQVITNACREGARAGIVYRSPRATDSEICAVASSYTGGHLVTFGTANAPGCAIVRTGNTFQSDLTVDVTYDYGFLVLSNLGFGSIQLGARAVMKME